MLKPQHIVYIAGEEEAEAQEQGKCAHSHQAGSCTTAVEGVENDHKCHSGESGQFLQLL